MRQILLAAVLVVCGTTARAEDKKADGPVTLKLVAKKDKYKFESGGQTAEEYKKHLTELAKRIEKGERRVKVPAPSEVDLMLVLTNTSKEDVTIYVGGDHNIYTFELTGGTGSVAMPSLLAFTADLRFPKEMTLAPGKSAEIDIKQLSDGLRGASRNVYWTGPGEYKLSARYQLLDKGGGKGAELKSAPVTITVEK
jgi:hypothetical protein